MGRGTVKRRWEGGGRWGGLDWEVGNGEGGKGSKGNGRWGRGEEGRGRREDGYDGGGDRLYV